MEKRALHDFVEEVSGQSHLRVEHDFGDGFVRLHTSEAERRQAAQDIQCSENILIELLRNSKDAHGSYLFVALEKQENQRTITVIDDGQGVPASMHRHIFEPRVTSKLNTSHKDAWGLHGRGMALYSIAANAKEARVVASAEGQGCALQVVTDTGQLPERTDQSTFPSFTLGENSQVAVRGPRNLLRCSCEFAIEVRNACSVFVGSPSEIASTLFAFGQSSLSATARAFCQDINDLPLVKRLACAADPAEFAHLAASLGLVLSERTARRIMDGQIAPVPPLLERIVIDDPAADAPKATRRAAKAKGLSLDQRAKDDLAHAAKSAFADVAADYYLEADVQPKVTAHADSIVISIPIVRSS